MTMTQVIQDRVKVLYALNAMGPAKSTFNVVEK